MSSELPEVVKRFSFKIDGAMNDNDVDLYLKLITVSVSIMGSTNRMIVKEAVLTSTERVYLKQQRLKIMKRKLAIHRKLKKPSIDHNIRLGKLMMEERRYLYARCAVPVGLKNKLKKYRYENTEKQDEQSKN